ncbi:MAG: RDD family protein [Acidimicrobiales bacterium]
MSDAPQQPPGWYYAQGDPPGTQRYWDGAQWQGGPQAAGGAGQAMGGAQGAGGTLAEPGKRLIAALIDGGIVLAGYIVLLILVVIISAISDTLGTLILILGYLAIVGFSIYNSWYLLGTTGQTIGKKHQGVTLLSEVTGQPVGMLQAFLRGLLQGLAWSLCWIPGLVDVVFIFTKPDHKRFTDGILNMNVYQA